ncbi:MAG: tRNA (adenosine(37)-N6)-dimethylallyltransferase MiaA [Bacteroidales bacterium]|nr:tRNA (adenosine(37)-N6)-dimethylallyltransferase MiaA [Bacteroidales bacterium]
MKKTAIIVTGPTAGGKSALSIDLAKALSTEIISADSRQIFADIPIVTAQPSIEERMGIPHHLMGHLPLDAYYSAACFEQDALDLSAHLFDRHDTAIVCGGSMMYVDAFCYGIDTLPTVPSDLRTALGELHRRKGDEWLLARLAQADPATFAGIDRKNIKRVFHALEITLAAGRPYSTLLTGQKKERPFRILKVIVERDREQLFARINNRVGDMQANGLLEEARRVYPLRGLNSLNTVGLKELFAHFDGLMSLDEALDRIRKNTRVFAKKQLTWLARPMHEDSPIETIRVRPDEADPVQKILSRL